MLDVLDFRKMTAHWRHKCHIQRLDAMLEETEPVRELGLLKRELLFLLLLLEIAASGDCKVLGAGTSLEAETKV